MPAFAAHRQRRRPQFFLIGLLAHHIHDVAPGQGAFAGDKLVGVFDRFAGDGSADLDGGIVERLCHADRTAMP